MINRIKRAIKNRVLIHGSKFVKRTLWYRNLFVDYDHERYPDNVWYRKHDERNFDVVNLGSSGGKWAFDYEGLPVEAMNWANQPQTLIEDFRLFKNFHSILRKGGKVLIVIMPFTGLNKRTGVMDCLKYVPTLYWDNVDDEHIDAARRLAQYPLLFGKPAIKAVIKHLLGREQPPALLRGSDADENPMSPSELEADAQRWMDGWARQFGIDDFEAPLTPSNLEGRQVRIKVMRDLIDFITERGYEPIYIIPPVASALSRRFTPKFRQLYIYDYLAQVDRKVRLLDYSTTPDFADSMFFNSFFLNLRGRKVFTQLVLEDLGLIKS